MTDAYDELVSLQDDTHCQEDKHAGDPTAAFDPIEANFPHQRQSAQEAGDRDPCDARLAAAEKRRQEFRSWLLQRARRSRTSSKIMEHSTAEERRAQRLERLQERLAAADANRTAYLARTQRRAASISERREMAAERAAAVVAERTTAVSERLEADLAAAENRRLALREAERERLRAEHELVLNRLAASQERATEGAERQRNRLEARLRTAASQREDELARRAARAAGKAGRRAERASASPQGRSASSGSGSGNRGEASASSSVDAADAAGVMPAAEAVAVGPADAAEEAESKGVVVPQVTEKGVVLALSGPDNAGTASSSQEREKPRVVVTAAADDEEAGYSADSDSDDTDVDIDADADAVHPSTAAVLEGLRRSVSSRKLQQGWRKFVQSKRTTRTLAEAFVAHGVTSLRLPGNSTVAAAAAGSPPPPPASQRAAGAVDMPKPRAAAAAAAAPAAAVLISPTGRARLISDDGTDGDVVGQDVGDGFDRFAAALRSPATLKATQALMRRLEHRLTARQASPKASSETAAATTAMGNTKAAAPSSKTGANPSATTISDTSSDTSSTSGGSSASNITRLLRRLFPQAARGAPLERYPPRVLLCAFMIVRHPEVVFSGSGPREAALAAAARDLVERFEVLLERIIVVQPDPFLSPSPSSAPPLLAASPVARGMEELVRRRAAVAAAAAAGAEGEKGGSSGGRVLDASGSLPASPSRSSPYMTIGSLLLQFDESWLAYLDQFVAWKGADAASLESELVRCAAALETSMLRKCRGDPTSERVRRSSDLQAVIAQTAHDLALLRERVAKLGGEAGLARLQAALEAARRAVAAEIAERGVATSGSGSASASMSEADTTDADSPARRTPRGSGSGSPTANTRRGPSSPPKLTLPLAVPPVAAPAPASPSAASGRGAPASAPIPVPERSGGPRSAAVGEGGGDAGGGGPAVAASPLSASPRTPGALDAAALSPAPPLDAALVSNAALVHQMLLLGAGSSSSNNNNNTGAALRLPAAEAEAVWSRAVTAVEKGTDGLSVLAPGPSPEELQGMDQEQLIRALRSRTAAIAECAFWDNLAAALGAAMTAPPRPQSPSPSQSGGSGEDGVAARLAGLLASLLSEMAEDVASVVSSPQQAASLRFAFSQASLRAEILGSTSGNGAGSTTTAAAASAIQRALGPLERLAALLVAAGAPAREPDALTAHEAMRRQLMAALTAPAPSAPAVSPAAEGEEEEEEEQTVPPPPPLAAALGRALRLLAAQVKLLKLDAANGRLQALAASLPGDTAVAYLRSKFATIFRLPTTGTTSQTASQPPVSQQPSAAAPPPASPAAGASSPPPAVRQSVRQVLPRTTAWLRRCHVGAGGIAQYICSQGLDLHAAIAAAAAASDATAVPLNLRTGRLRNPASLEAAAATSGRPVVAPVVPVGPEGDRRVSDVSGSDGKWRWVVRCGLAALVSSDVPAVGPGLAETLLWDGERLHAAQNQFQQLVVVTAGLLLVTQLRAAAAARAAAPDAAAAAAAWGPAARSAAARRLLVVVADPAMRLPDLTTELAALAGVAGDEGAEARLRSAFMSLVDPSSAAFRSLTNALAAALLLHMTLGSPPPLDTTSAEAAASAASGSSSPAAVASDATVPTGPAAAAASLLLGRVGATGLAADVAALGQQLLALCAVNEAVHADVYDILYGEILAEEDEKEQRGEQQIREQEQDQGAVAEAAAAGVPLSPEQRQEGLQGGIGGGAARANRGNGTEEEGLAEGDEI